MTTAWLLLLLIVSSQSVDSQSTTDEVQVCDGEQLSDMKREHFIELKRDIQKILQRLGKSCSKTYECGYKNSFKSESMYVFKTNAKRI